MLNNLLELKHLLTLDELIGVKAHADVIKNRAKGYLSLNNPNGMKQRSSTPITASEAYKTLTPGARLSYLKQKLNLTVPFCGNKYTNWGKTFEDTALQKVGEFNDDFILKIGFLNHEKYPFIGATADGICKNSGYLVEVKCPYGERNIVLNSISDIPKSYYVQIQVQMEVYNVNACIFGQLRVGLGLIRKDEYYQIIVPRDENYFKEILPKFIEFNEAIIYYQKNLEIIPSFIDNLKIRKTTCIKRKIKEITDLEKEKDNYISNFIELSEETEEQEKNYIHPPQKKSMI